MSLIQWKNEFSVGIDAVDLEHRELIELINDLHALLGKNATHAEVTEMLGEIFVQISGHFALEEKYMRDTGYPQFAEHKNDHESLLDQIRDIMDRVEDDGRYDERRLSSELEAWFSEHFRTHDARLHQHWHRH